MRVFFATRSRNKSQWMPLVACLRFTGGMISRSRAVFMQRSSHSLQAAEMALPASTVPRDSNAVAQRLRSTRLTGSILGRQGADETQCGCQIKVGSFRVRLDVSLRLPRSSRGHFRKGQRLEGVVLVAAAVCSGSGVAGKIPLAELPRIPAG